MPTQPLKTVLYREFDKVQIQDILVPITPLLQELVNNGTNVLIRCIPTKGIDYEDIAPLALYRHILEITDAFEVLIAESCASPTVPILRSAFEALLSLEFILESTENYKMRSLAWYAQDIQSRIKSLEYWLPKTERGRQFQESLKMDKTILNIGQLKEIFSEESKIQETVDNLNKLLSDARFEPILKEFHRLRKEKKKNDWFCLFDGPKDRHELAYYLNRIFQYDFIYRRWSGITHANDASPLITKTEDGRGGIRGIRDPSSINEVSMFAVLFMIDATKLMLNKFRTGESFEKYYLDEIQGNFMKLINNSKTIRFQHRTKKVSGQA